MRPAMAVFIALYACRLPTSAAVIAFSHTSISAGPGELPSSPTGTALDGPERLSGENAAAGPKGWVNGHWVNLDRQIPKKIWVTGQWSSDSEEVNAEITKNIGDPIVEKRAAIQRGQVEAYFARWVPVGSYVRYFTDQDMDSDVRAISEMLAPKGIRDMEKLYSNLRPGAFRADVWRVLKLWAEGGVYLDANINLTRKINDWINFSSDGLVIVRDTGVVNGYWNAMMASAPKDDYLLHAVMLIRRHLSAHYYGSTPLAITGPTALYKAFRAQAGFPRGIRLDLEWKGGKVLNKAGEVMARKDGALHDHDPSRHYDPMCRHHQVYCDQKGPNPDNGMCAHG
jgi:hypothetical protein